MTAAKIIPIDAVVLALRIRAIQPQRRWAAYSTHPYVGSDCANPHGWRAHGGPLFSPWCTGYIDSLAERTKALHGRREVLRTFGVGIRALHAEINGAGVC